jgi:hypothetical protein
MGWRRLDRPGNRHQPPPEFQDGWALASDVDGALILSVPATFPALDPELASGAPLPDVRPYGTPRSLLRAVPGSTRWEEIGAPEKDTWPTVRRAIWPLASGGVALVSNLVTRCDRFYEAILVTSVEELAAWNGTGWTEVGTIDFTYGAAIVGAPDGTVYAAWSGGCPAGTPGLVDCVSVATFSAR